MTEIESLNIPVSGDYAVVAHAEVQTHGEGLASAWNCELNASNGGGAGQVNLDSVSVTQYAGGGISSSATPIPLQGVVSLAAGGNISIWCRETIVQKNDTVAQARITATQVSSFTAGT